jgi:hypothetical protein
MAQGREEGHDVSRTSWNNSEDEALRKVTWMARLVYLQGIRMRMDYATGIAGKTAVISYQSILETLDCSTHTTRPDPIPTKRMLQRSFEALERAGLVEWIKPETGAQQRGIVFRCLLADTQDSVQKQAVPKRYPSGTQKVVPDDISDPATFRLEAVPKRYPSGTQQAVPPLVSGNPEENTPPTPPRGETRKRFVPPTVEQVRAYCLERCNQIDPQQFVDFYAATDWTRGKTKLKDWKAAVRTWERNRADTAAAAASTDDEVWR